MVNPLTRSRQALKTPFNGPLPPPHLKNSQKMTGARKNLGVDHFPDPVGHFEAPWQPFWIFEVLIEGMMKSKNLFSES